ncbi:hypothetical protein QQY66_42575 [Streptomyces sp. DG2A-72]|uniref:hypothetical protein n=1 Tax=Streptomyces sp. DG2A-72 TaxID=3051386 RepID=UPI00265BE9A5|nr:hypothetical protein [Streptomyces sp. DG2A-72]MDO0938088.1 hypothetical protein [Streptomyces sp. DG2A-72]
MERVCEDHAGYESAAAYRDPAPHPLVVFPVTGDPDFVTGPEPAPEDVQLVACATLIGRVSDTSIAACAYKDHSGSSYRVDYYQGRYRATVYEARTGRTVGSIPPERSRQSGGVEPSGTDCSIALTDYETGSAKR